MNFFLPTYQLTGLTLAYGAYLCWVMFGGMRKKQAKLRRLLGMIILLFWAFGQTYTGIHCAAEAIDLAVIIAIALAKGLCLGCQKQLEAFEGIYYIWHDFSYVALWLLFFTGKVVFSQWLTVFTHVTMPLWHMVFYFCLYFTLRAIIVVCRYPQAFFHQYLAKH